MGARQTDSSEKNTTFWRIVNKAYGPFTVPSRSFQGYGRFDDPSALRDPDDDGYGVLYVGETPEAAFIEMCGPLRPQLSALVAARASLLLDVRERESLQSDYAEPVLGPDWYSEKVLGKAELRLHFPLFDLSKTSDIHLVRDELAELFMFMGLQDLDLSDLTSLNRRLTKAISRWAWARRDDDGIPSYSGIRYVSRYGADSTCAAIFEARFTVPGGVHTEPITPSTPAFITAAESLRLTIR